MKLGEITLNGKQVSIFAPPHDEPDLPWVDVEELAKAYMPRAEARKIISMTHQFGKGVRSYATAKNGDRIATIIPHAMAQGLCGAMDQWRGDAREEGPVFLEYCGAAGRFFADKVPMSIEDIVHAFHNPGGKFLRGAL